MAATAKWFEQLAGLVEPIEVFRQWVQAQDGLALDGHTFVLRSASASPRKDAAGPPPQGTAPSKLRPGVPGGAWPPGGAGQSATEPVPLLEVLAKDERRGLQHLASFEVRTQSLGGDAFACYIGLGSWKGFDSAVGYQMAVAFDGVAIEDPDGAIRHALTFAGWGNRAGVGFKRFHGQVVASCERGKVTLSPGRMKVLTPTSPGSIVPWGQTGFSLNLER